MLSKRTAKNQLTLPKAIVEEVGSPTYFDTAVKDGKIVLTPVRVGSADAVRAKLKELGVTESDVKQAVTWARRRRRRP